jgi:hypothetical protein
MTYCCRTGSFCCWPPDSKIIEYKILCFLILDNMAFWLIRAGRHGEQEQAALVHNVTTIGWNDLPDLSNIPDRESFKQLYSKVLTQERPAAASACRRGGKR